ncbi:hypothetical protein [Amycolatopsis sp. cmx-4-83]|uniref:hypothetical protein n=1 Tax=Amycolatopsis sp. cmx-4-83 TaxID=2790940 RepID=UPI00397D2C04
MDSIRAQRKLARPRNVARSKVACRPDVLLLLVGHTGVAQVGAEHVHHGLALPGVALPEPFERVDPGQPHRSRVRAEQFCRFGVQLGDPPLDGVPVVVGGDFPLLLQRPFQGPFALQVIGFGGPLPPPGQEQRDQENGPPRQRSHRLGRGGFGHGGHGAAPPWSAGRENCAATSVGAPGRRDRHHKRQWRT